MSETQDALLEIIGAESLAVLSELFGGAPMKIPKTEKGGNYRKLVEALGEEKAAAVRYAFQGEAIYFAAPKKTQLAERDAAILAALETGEPPREIARRAGSGRPSPRWNPLTGSRPMTHTEYTTSISGLRTRQPCGFFVPASLAALRQFFWRDERGKYNTRKGNTPRRLIAVVESRRPLLRGGDY